MMTEQRRIFYDADLNIEAYHLSGVVQKFPNHFHDYYVIGFLYGGKRHLWCKGEEYDLSAGDLILFNPRDNHFCAPIDGENLDYQAVNVKPEVMQKAVREITGREYQPYFVKTVVYQSDITLSLKSLYDAILRGAPKMEREEAFLLLLEQVLLEYSTSFEEADLVKPDGRVKMLCDYIETHFAENITLDTLSELAGLSKYYLLRCFTKQVGVSPYRYLQTIRIGKTKQLLEQGISPLEAALQTGFSDQSHFSNFFKEFIGLTPKQYMKIFTHDVSKIKQEVQNETK